MRMRTVFIVLLILVLLIGFGPALLAVGRREIAEAFGCECDLNRVIPCVIGGKDYGRPFYDLGFSIWYPYLIVPIGLVLLGVLGGGSTHRAYHELAETQESGSG